MDGLWFCCFVPAKYDFRDRFSGAVEAFSRRNTTSTGRHRTSEEVPSSKDVVSLLPHPMENLLLVLTLSYTCAAFCSLDVCSLKKARVCQNSNNMVPYKYSNLIQKGAALLEMALLQRELPFQQADRPHLANPLMAVLADWWQLVVVFPPLKESNLELSINHHHFLVLLKEVVMILFEALSSSLSAGSNWDGFYKR